MRETSDLIEEYVAASSPSEADSGEQEGFGEEG